ncbi:MAG: adenylate/guanylate cyclase domain-containing protein [Acidimicrobiaceae bacterium]|nr:adenylate/guanylate cyclase domain-containing protein [Acidimicrobiaceae bacterium]
MGNDTTTALRPLRWADHASSAVGLGGTMSLPAGTVSFLLTDIEGSTQKWQLAPDEMAVAVARHYEILDLAISAHGGVRPEEQGEGDSIVAAFSRASDALSAALDAQRALQREPWPASTPIAVRMAIHTGEARLRDEANYVGMAIIRTARLRSLALGGQVLVSSASRDLALDQLGDEISLKDLGEHRLKDLARPERVYQLAHSELTSEFAPLRSLDATPNNLPVRLSTFIGRVDELTTLATLVATQRMVTITGSGGAGKTRLALQMAAEQVDRFADGVWWIELAPLAEAGDVAIEMASLLSVQLERDKPPSHSIAQRLGNDATLLVFDNCEHLVEPVAELIATVLQRCPNVVVLATSRGPRSSGRDHLAGPAACAALAGRGVPHRAAGSVRRRAPLPRSRAAGAAGFRAQRRQRAGDRRDLPASRRHPARDRARRCESQVAGARAHPRRARRCAPPPHRRPAPVAAAPADPRGFDRVEREPARRPRTHCAFPNFGVQRLVRSGRGRGHLRRCRCGRVGGARLARSAHRSLTRDPTGPRTGGPLPAPRDRPPVRRPTPAGAG